VGRQLGAVSAAVSILTGIAALASVAVGDPVMALRCGVAAVTLGGGAWALTTIAAPEDIQFNEALTVVALVFLLAPLAMTYPFMSIGLGFMDAFFEAVSGITTTGLSVTGTVVGRPDSFLLVRSWTQWYGGLGFVVLSTVLVLRPGAGTKRLLAAELDEDDLVGGTRAHARRVLAVYLGLTLVGFVLLWSLGAGFLEGVIHTLSAVSTGGFSSHDASVAALPGPARGVTVLLFLAGAVPFTIYWRTRQKGVSALLGDEQLRALLAFGLTVSLLLFLWSFSGAGGESELGERLGDSLLTGFSAQTTTGFHTMSPGGLDAGPKLLLILSMLAGGSAGSTAGGIKLVRVLLFFRILRLTMDRTALPKHAVAEGGEAGGGSDPGEIRGALLMAVLFAVALAVSWLAFLAHGHPPLDSLFDVASALGTVGLSTGVTAPSLTLDLKLVLCADMLLGRLEFVALLVLFYPPTWFGSRRSAS